MGGGLCLLLPSINPAQELPSLLVLPSFKVSHPAEQNTADQGRDRRTKGEEGKKKIIMIKADRPTVLVKMEKVCPGAFKTCEHTKAQ